MCHSFPNVLRLHLVFIPYKYIVNHNDCYTFLSRVHMPMLYLLSHLNTIGHFKVTELNLPVLLSLLFATVWVSGGWQFNLSWSVLVHVSQLNSFVHPECTSTIPALSGWMTPESPDGITVGHISGGPPTPVARILLSVYMSVPAQQTICRSL